MMKLFLDTNILLDILQGKRPSHQTSSLILEGAKKQLYEVQISIQSIADVTYIAIRNGIPFDAVSRLSSWMLDHVNVDGPIRSTSGMPSKAIPEISKTTFTTPMPRTTPATSSSPATASSSSGKPPATS